MEEIIKALQLKNQLDALRPIDKEQEARIMQKFRLDWNYHSNNLEGNSLTYGETKALLMHGITAQGKPLKDHFEVTGHNEAIEWVIDVVKGDYPLTENFIRELHTLLLKESYEVDAVTPDGKPTKKRIGVGKYKSSPNHVKTKTGEIFYFATPEETPAKMSDLIAWYREKTEETNFNLILLAAEFHYKFIRIHPFDDGNGRTARILMNFILMKFGYPPVIIKTDDKANYFSALQLADTGNIEAFTEYIAKNLNRSLEIMIAGAKGESIEEPDDIDKEIALLEKRLNNIGNLKVSKTNETVLDIFDKVLEEIIILIRSKGKKLEDFYSETYSFYQIDGRNHRYDDIKYMSLANRNNVTLSIYYSHFKATTVNTFDYITEVRCVFEPNSYSILNDNGNVIRKSYNSYLSESEIDKVALIEVKRHKDFIEQKVIEKEKGE